MAQSLTVKNFLAILEDIASFSLAETWDNVGLMVGNPDQVVTKILIALDPTEAILDEALGVGAEIVVTHHPLIFHPLKAVRTDQVVGRFLRLAIKNTISVVGCHTNLDQATGGVNDALASAIGLVKTEPITRKADGGTDNMVGFGRLGHLSDPMSSEDFIKHLLCTLDLSSVNITGKLPEKINVVGLCGGSGSDLAESAYDMGAQVYVTGEVKHSTARWAEANGFCIIDAGHYATEYPVVPALQAILQKTFSTKGLDIDVFITSKQKNPFQLYQLQDNRIADHLL